MKLNIEFKKTCSCPDSHMNSLTSKELMKVQIAIWELYYEGRDIRDKRYTSSCTTNCFTKKIYTRHSLRKGKISTQLLQIK